MLGYEEKVERLELLDAVAEAGRLARGLDQLLEFLAHADQLDPLDVEGILALRSISERFAERIGDAARILEAQNEVCVLSSSRRQNWRYDFDTFGVSRADLFFYSRDLPSISAFSILLLAPPNSTSLPWCMMRSMMAEASLSSPNTTPHLLNSIFVVITRLRFS